MNAVRVHRFGGGPQDLVYEDVLVSVASQDVPQLLINFRHISKKKEIHMELMQRGLLFIPAGTNLSELEI
jgi:hypothetical protein